MALIIARNSDGSSPVGTGETGTPIEKTVTLDGSGGTENTDVKTFYLFADDGMYYDQLALSVIQEEPGISYLLSLSDSPYSWQSSVEPADIDATSQDQAVPFYVTAELVNDGSGDQPGSATYSGARIRLQYLEHGSNPN